jgi:hypothetical protein
VALTDDGPLLHLLEVDGTSSGYVASLEGGWGTADVIEEPSPTGIKKRPGPPRWEELELRLALPIAARPVVDWIAAAWRREVQAKDLLVTTVDGEGNVLRRREFRNALLTATTISGMEPGIGSGLLPLGGPGFATLRLLPQHTRTTFPGGTVSLPSHQDPGLLHHRLELSGLDCRQVMVEEFTVQQAFGSVMADRPGLRVWREPGLLSFPNLTVTVGETSAGAWQRWFENFVLQGYNDDTNEKTGTLWLLDDRMQALAQIGLFNVGIFQLIGPIIHGYRLETGQIVRRTYVVAGLYCERMEFTLP